MKQMLSATVSRVLLAGATGYIGRVVAAELVSRGYQVLALVRPGSGAQLDGCQVLEVELTDRPGLNAALEGESFAAVISCIASRSGVAADAWLVDHDANQNLLALAKDHRVQRFVLLSAICVQKPRLAFQRAKLAFEDALAGSGIAYSIVRPTAFFKSLAGQVERVRQGSPFLIFGDGELTRCKPISEEDLARFIVDQLDLPGGQSAVLPIGGPGPAISLRQQGEMIFELLDKPPRFRSVPPGVLRGAAALLSFLGLLSKRLADKAELARIGHYYATESMLVWDEETSSYQADATPETGTVTLREFYERVLEHGLQGQELGAARLFREAKNKKP
jgi:divinyl chlorophyllide a 8-vinyl-reductase